MKDKYKAYLYILIVGFMLFFTDIGLFLNNFVDSLDLPGWGEFLVILIPLLPVCWWMRNERQGGSAIVGIAVGFIIGVLIGKKID